MSKFDKYVFLPSFSLQPNKVVSFNSVFIKDHTNNQLKTSKDFKKTKALRFKGLNDNNIIKRSSHNFQISDNAYRNLKKKINWLYYLAKSKQVKTYNGKSIYNFKIGFITLTLPSKQRTCTKDVTTNLLNTFLTEIRQRTKMSNYVWRLEFQKNGNVHYHIVTDTYIDFYLCQSIWNRILKNNGYIEEYQKKFKDLNLSQYRNIVDPDHKQEYNLIVKRYAKGKSTKWTNPNSIDVKSVVSNRAISNYISKYFSKDCEDNPQKNEFDTEENSNNLRLWFCSRSLSKLNTVTNFCEAVKYDIFSIVSHCKKIKRYIHKYAICYYFEISEMSGNARKWIEIILKDYSKKQGYIPAD